MKKEAKEVDVFITYQPSWAQIKIAALDSLYCSIIRAANSLLNAKDLVLQISAVTNKIEYSKFTFDKLAESMRKFDPENITERKASNVELDNYFLARCFLELFVLTLHGSITAMARLVWLVYELEMNGLKDRYVSLETVRDSMQKHHSKIRITKVLNETSKSVWYAYVHALRIQLEHGDNIPLVIRGKTMYLPDDPINSEKKTIKQKYEVVSWCEKFFNNTIGFHDKCSAEIRRLLFKI